MANKGETPHHIRMDTERWQRLSAIAAGLVHDDELPNGLGLADSRTGVMMRLIADGVLVVQRQPDSTM